jgi:ATP-binding cassette subfamily B protein
MENFTPARMLPEQLRRLYGHITLSRRRQLLGLLILQIVTGASEVLGLGTILPFLATLADSNSMLNNPVLVPWLRYFKISEPSELIIAMAILFSVAVIFANVMRIITLRVQMQLSAQIGSELSVRLFDNMLHQSYEFHVNSNSSSMISEIVNDLNGTLSIIYNALSFVTQALVVLFIFAALLFFNVAASLLMVLLASAAYALVLRLTHRRLHQNSRTIAASHVRLIQVLQEGFGGIRDVLIDCSQKTFVGVYRNADLPMRRANMDNQFIRMAPRFFLEAVGVSIIACIAAVFAWRADDFRAVLPLLGTMALAANRLMPAVQAAYASLAGIQGSQESLARTLIGLDRISRSDESYLPKVEPLGLRKSLLLDKVSFRYSGNRNKIFKNEWILNKITLTIPANNTIALVGVTGSGKSTIADITLGLLKPQRGKLILDGISLTDLDSQAWRASVAHVPQSIFLSDGSFIENIAFGVPPEDVDIEGVRNAAKLACISEFIESRSSGYEEIIGEGGMRLSGGQRQRIGIARALYKQASLIVFDEATSALDNTTEREVMKAIQGLKGRVTVLIIAHRTSTVEQADCIYEIGAGRVLHSGTFKELLERSPSFCAMVGQA